jgi:hypothetical protein
MSDVKLKHLQLIAAFMIVLVVAMPIYSASVFAGISKVTAKGSDGFEDYARRDDYVTFEATVSIDSEEILASQVWLGENLQFDTCTAGIEGYECTLRYPSEGTAVFDVAATPYTVILKDSDGNTVDVKSGTFYVDDLPPQLTSFSIEPSFIGSGEIKIAYAAEDKACSGCEGKCIGLKELKLYELNGSYEEVIPINNSGCTYSGEVSKDSSLFSDGEHTIYAEAYDLFGYASSVASATFTVDNTPPTIDSASFTITDENGNPLEYASSNPVPVVAYIEVTGDDIQSVKGDFSSISPGYNDVEAQCTNDNGVFKCTWNIELAVSGEEPQEITITARDLAGNEANVTVSVSFAVDNTGPVVNSIETSRVVDGKSYAKLENNNFIADITEDGAGLNPNQVLLHVGNNVINADNCTVGWTCYWNGVSISASTTEVSIESDTTDRLGNSAAPFSAEIIVDSEPPRLINISITNIGGAEAALENYTKTGDSLQITAILEDEAIATAYADLSAVIQDAENVEADSCTDLGDGRWECSWITASIDISGYIEGFIHFEFEDVAGNVLEHTEAIVVYGVDEGEANYWENEVKCSPRLIDRETTSLINQKVFCHVKLKPLVEEDLMPLRVSLAGCSNDTTAVQETELFNNQQGSRDLYLKFILKKQDFNVNELNLNCELTIISKAGNTISSPEEEIVEIKLEFYNLPLGELSDNIKEQIEDAIEDATSGFWKIVGWANKIVFYARKICSILNVFYNIVAAYQLLTSALGNAEDALALWQPVKAKLYGDRLAQCTATERIKEASVKDENMFDKFCKFINCRHFYDIKILEKWNEKGMDLLSPLGGDFIREWTGKDPRDYMDPKNSMVVSVLTACIPGIIYNLEKYRQIKCMYAYCLQEGVKQQGLPVTACEDQKAYAECKYIMGEVFNAFPITAIFNHYISMIRNVLSNPFIVIGAAAALSCIALCPGPTEKPHGICIGVKIAALLGDAIADVTSILDEGFKIKDDYCDKLEEEDEEESEDINQTAT